MNVLPIRFLSSKPGSVTHSLKEGNCAGNTEEEKREKGDETNKALVMFINQKTMIGPSVA